MYLFVRAPGLSIFAYNLGVGIDSGSGTWTLRPEIGWLHFTENENFFMQFGRGLELRMR